MGDAGSLVQHEFDLLIQLRRVPARAWQEQLADGLSEVIGELVDDLNRGRKQAVYTLHSRLDGHNLHVTAKAEGKVSPREEAAIT